PPLRLRERSHRAGEGILPGCPAPACGGAGRAAQFRCRDTMALTVSPGVGRPDRRPRLDQGRESGGRMITRDNRTTGCRPAPYRTKVGPWGFVLTACAVTVLAVACPGCGDSPGKPGEGSGAKVDLPEISAFLTKPSDRFLVDIEEVSRGHPLLGVNSPHPHGGGHVHFDNSKKRWPKGKDEPASYPAIYAVADGVVGRIDTRFGLPGGNHRYGVDLIFAKDQAGAAVRFCFFIQRQLP